MDSSTGLSTVRGRAEWGGAGLGRSAGQGRAGRGMAWRGVTLSMLIFFCSILSNLWTCGTLAL